MVVHLLWEQGVGGSNPSTPTTFTYILIDPTTNKECLIVEKEGVHKLSELTWKDRMIADESKEKYRAYKKIAELQQEIEKLKKRLKDE